MIGKKINKRKDNFNVKTTIQKKNIEIQINYIPKQDHP